MGKIDSISRALETEHGIDLSTGKIVNVVEHLEKNELSVFDSIDEPEDIVDVSPVHEVVQSTGNDIDQDEVEYRKDEDRVKRNLRDLIEKGMDIADEMLEIVRISETPKAFDPAANFLKTIAELNEKLLDVHDRSQKRKNGGNKNTKVNDTTPQNGTVNNIQNNNTVIVKDPAAVLKLIKANKKVQ